MLQPKEMNLSIALPLLDTAMETVHAMKNDDTVEKIWREIREISTTQEPPEPKRSRRESTVLAEYVIESSPYASHTGVRPHEEMRRIFTSIFDQVNAELASRFSERSMEFVKSMNALDVKDGDFLNFERLQPLLLLLQRLNLKDLKAELPVAKSFIRNKLVSQRSDTGMKECPISETLYHYREAFPQIYALFTAAVTFGASTAVCENAFSTLTRRSMLQSLMRNLVLLSFERAINSRITSDELLKKLRSRPRRLIVWFGIHVCLQSWTLFVLCNTLQYTILSNNFWFCICGSIVPPSQFPLPPQNRVLSYGPGCIIMFYWVYWVYCIMLWITV